MDDLKNPAVLAVPLYFALIWWEVRALTRLKAAGKDVLGYERRDTWASLLIGAVSLITVGGLNLVVKILSEWLWDYRLTDLGNGILGWTVALLGWDFAYYWLHRVEHESLGRGPPVSSTPFARVPSGRSSCVPTHAVRARSRAMARERSAARRLRRERGADVFVGEMWHGSVKGRNQNRENAREQISPLVLFPPYSSIWISLLRCRGQPARSHALTKRSRSPSSTPCVSLVLMPVRKSFTI